MTLTGLSDIVLGVDGGGLDALPIGGVFLRRYLLVVIAYLSELEISRHLEHPTTKTL